MACPLSRRKGTALRELTMDELIRLAYESICKMEKWMLEHVRRFGGFSEDDRRSFKNVLGLYLSEGICPCTLEICARRHNVAAWPNSGIENLSLFVDCAVIGPVEFKAESLKQGMLYRLLLKPEQDMLVAPVELKECQVCGEKYE